MKDLLKEWKQRLGLQDWHIVLRENCSPNDMVLQSVAGECEKDEVNKCAVIRIVSKKDYGDRIIPFNKEKVLIHELLHIKFWIIENTENDMQNRIVHQLIDDIARALIDAKRSGKDKGE